MPVNIQSNFHTILCTIAATVFTMPLLAQQTLTPNQTADLPSPEPISYQADHAPAHLQQDAAFGRLPISFEVNRGQTSQKVQFLSRGRGYALFLTPGETVLSVNASQPDTPRNQVPNSWKQRRSPRKDSASSTSRSSVVRMRLIAANIDAKATGEDEQPGKSNYFSGADSARWHTDVPTYAKVRYRDVYPGIDLLFYGNTEGRLEHDFILSAGADPGRIVFQFGDNQSIATEEDGGLVLRTGSGDVTLQRPVAYQDIDGHRIPVSASYAVAANRQVRFLLGEYDHSAALIIDPVVIFTAVFGGTGGDEPTGVALDNAGNVYICGITSSLDFPIINPGPWTKNTATGFVSKMNAAGTSLLYSTYFGGGSTPTGIKVDSKGRIYVAGYTGPGFPVSNAHQPSFGGGPSDAFLAAISPEGNSLIYSTYLGGSQWDYAMALAVDASGNAYMTGRTDGGFPALHSLQPQDPQGAFIAKFSPTGVLQYSSIYGNVVGQSTAIDVDKYGAAYVTGYTDQPTITITPNVFRSTCPEACSWVFKLNPSGDSLAYATYLGVNGDAGFAIAVDSDLNAYVGGGTQGGFPVWSSGFQRTYGGAIDGFVAKLNTTGSKLIWSTYLGGRNEDVIYSLALDQYRQVYVTGVTASPDFPLKSPVQAFAGVPGVTPWQPFITTLSGSLGSIVYYSTNFGPATEAINSMELAVDKALNVYVVGGSAGTFKATQGALAPGAPGNPGGGNDTFVSKLSIMADLWMQMSAENTWVGSGNNFTFVLVVTNQGPDFAVNVRVSDTLPPNTTFVSYDGGGGTCTTPPVGGTGTFTCQLPRLENGAWWASKLTVKVMSIPPGNTLYNYATVVSNMQDPNLNDNSVSSIGVWVE